MLIVIIFSLTQFIVGSKGIQIIFTVGQYEVLYSRIRKYVAHSCTGYGMINVGKKIYENLCNKFTNLEGMA